MSTDEAVEKLKSDIRNAESPSIPIVPVELVQNYGSKTGKLLGPIGVAEAVPGRSRRYEIRFKEPILASDIEIFCSGYPNNSEFLIEIELINGGIELLNAVTNEDSVFKEIDQLVIAISFTPPSISLSNTLIKRIEVSGIEINQTRSFLRHIFFVESRKKEALALIDKELRSTLEQRAVLAALQSTRDGLAAEADRLKLLTNAEEKKLLTLGQKIKDRSNKLNDLRSENEQMDHEINKLKRNINNLDHEKSDLESLIKIHRNEFKELNNQVNIFPSEISGFASQGRRDVRLYSSLCFIPLLIISIVTYQLFQGAVNLTTIVTSEKEFNIAALIASRAPFVLTAIAIVSVCYYIARMLILKCVRVNRQKLNLTKISVVAKDISYSVENGISISDDEKYARRMRLKMDLMRDHLREYISKDFEPSLPDRLPNMADVALSSATPSPPTP